ncbi:hypothetical protein DFH28DRAFT_248351 [Melampsora americana]|nr:hypothetical protein DFH28DRAFT_248351 [Melampsora americana]
MKDQITRPDEHRIENQKLFQKIKPNTISIFKEILKLQNNQQTKPSQEHLYQSLLNLYQILTIHSTHPFNSTLIHYTIYPIQHLLSFSTSIHSIPDSSLELSFKIIQSLLSKSNVNKSIALIEQESHLLDSLLIILGSNDHLNLHLIIIETIEIILNQEIQLNIQFIKPIFKSILNLITNLFTSKDSSISLRSIRLIHSSLLKLSTSQITHQDDGIRLITTLLPKSVSNLVKLIISLSNASKSSKVLIKSIELLQWMILFCLDESLDDIHLLIHSINTSKENQNPLRFSKLSSIQVLKVQEVQSKEVLIKRDLQWLQITIKNLVHLLDLLSNSLNHHSNHQVRQSWTILATRLLQRLPNLLKLESSTIIKTLSIPIILNQTDQTPLDINLIESHLIEFGKSAIDLIKKEFKALAKLLIYKVKDEDDVLIYHSEAIMNALEVLSIILKKDLKFNHWFLDEVLEDFELIQTFQKLLNSIKLIISPLMNHNPSNSIQPIVFKHLLNLNVMKSIQDLIQSVGKVLSLMENDQIEIWIYEFFLKLILNEDHQVSSNQSFNSIWILNDLLIGSQLLMINRKKNHKRIETFFKKSLGKLIDEFEQEDQDQKKFKSMNQELIKEGEEEDHMVVRHTKGLNPLPELDKLRPTISSNEDQDQESDRVLRISLLLHLLSSISTKLSTSFQPSLSILLYPILRYTDHPFHSTQVRHTLNQFAYETSYGSVENMITDHLDYIVDSISNRISFNQRIPDLKASNVMASLIEIVGVKESFGIVGESLVNEMGEGVRDFHQDEDYLDGVLDGYLRVIRLVGEVVLEDDQENERLEKEKERVEEEEEGEGEGEENEFGWFVKLEKKRKRFEELVWFRRCDDEENEEEERNEREELDRFKEWYCLREKVLNRFEDVEDKVEINPGVPFQREETIKDKVVEEEVAEEEQEKPMGLYERVTLQIVSQILPFLNHSSSLIKAKVIEILKISLDYKVLKTEEKVIPILIKFKRLIEKEARLKKVLKDHERFKMYFFKQDQKDLILKEKEVWNGFLKQDLILDLMSKGDDDELEDQFKLNYLIWKKAREGELIGMEFMMNESLR